MNARIPVRLAALATLAAALPQSTPAQANAAQADAKQELQASFRRLDVNADGFLLRAEFPGSDRQFAAMDRDTDGKATEAEYLGSEVAKAFVRARERNRSEPRPRTATLDTVRARFALLARADTNRDGRVDRAEWTGSAAAFAELDFDGNGVLDRKDRAEAEATAPPAPPPPPEWRGDVPPTEELFAKLDKDGDARISAKEAAAAKPLAALFAQADRDADRFLDERELGALLQEVMRRRYEADAGRGGGKPEPFRVPFGEWDANGDGKVQVNEWQGPRPLFERIDLDRDAAVSKDEAARWVKRVQGDDFVERFDLDGDGRVTKAEFAGPADAFRRADKNGDGAVTRGDK